MQRITLTILALAIALITATTTAAHADAPPVASGTLREPSQNAAWGTWEAFTVSSNSFGFFLRFHPTNGHILTVMPSSMTADGGIAFTYIDYLVVGASNTDVSNTQGWQWQEVAGGTVTISAVGATATSVEGTITQTYTMVGYTRVGETNPRTAPIRLTVP